jgi:hypothetical protein
VCVERCVERATDTTVLIIENHRIKGAVKVIKAVKMPHACRDRGWERGGREGEGGRGRNLVTHERIIHTFILWNGLRQRQAEAERQADAERQLLMQSQRQRLRFNCL